MKLDIKELNASIAYENCPEGCLFRSRKTGMALLPPPERVACVLISRDPTSGWQSLYAFAQTEDAQTCRKMLFASAIPSKLCSRILGFAKPRFTDEKQRTLYNLIFRRTHWTHLHKCFTNPSNARFRSKYAKLCANTWLNQELSALSELKPRLLIALGADVRGWLQEEGWIDRLPSTTITLPHTSGQNNPIWGRNPSDRYREQIQSTDREIMKLRKMLTNL